MNRIGAGALRKSDEPLFDAVVNGIAFIIVVIVAYPLVYVISASFSSPLAVVQGEVWLLPVKPSLDSYAYIITDARIWNGYRNTVLYAVVGTTVNLALTILAAYPLSRKDLPGRNVLMFLMVFTMYFSGGIIPTYLVVRQLGLINRFWVMILPTAISTYNLIVMRTYFQASIPRELLESGFIDGAGNFRLLLAIVLPLSAPIIAVISLFYAVDHWNAFFNALIYLRDAKLYPLQLVLREILLASSVVEDVGMDNLGLKEQLLISEGIKYAIILVSTLPVMCIYPFIQKYFVKGIMIGAIKG
jgi:putative aldouronate transport system permease protein